MGNCTLIVLSEKEQKSKCPMSKVNNLILVPTHRINNYVAPLALR